jgi:GT2 family glycosyltransferase
VTSSTAVDIPHPVDAHDNRRPTRVQTHGKFIFVGNEKLYVRGVTYGTFRPDSHGHEYPDPHTVAADFAQMAANGINAVRTYTMPPDWLLDSAASYGLRVMVSLAVERYIGHLADNERLPAHIRPGMRAAIRNASGHPAILCYSIGNEIPASTVRWLGKTRVERYLQRIYDLIKAEDPGGLVTYVNYPTTEYLQLPFLDLVCFNVYLESPQTFEAYLSRLQNIAGDRPLMMTEVGLDSIRNGEGAQANVLDWQVRAAFSAGCAGAFVYSWTDEWHRGGEDVHDWAFGLVRRDRSPKPALAHVKRSFQDVPFMPRPSGQNLAGQWPTVSVVVCSFNGSSRIRDCCEALRRLEYPEFEVIVVDDGSTDRTGDIAEEYGFRVIRTCNGGLSNARNVGLNAAVGEIVAYIDDDAYPDPHWLCYLAVVFRTSDYVGVGGPNLVPAEDGPFAHCVANSPGGPVHILLTDHEAEHIPGCNMAFRRHALQAIDGFDPRFRVAGDDVDVCWRLLERGWKLGFSPSALVWHRRRSSIRAYWKQQKGYGQAEALLEAKWPEKYNFAGYAIWSGRIYDHTPRPIFAHKSRVYHGVWGTAPFQHVYEPPTGTLQSLPHMPEWHLITAALLLIAPIAMFWEPLLWTIPTLMVPLGLSVLQGLQGARTARFNGRLWSKKAILGLRLVTAFLHIIQPLARLHGRIRYGLAPWRYRGSATLCLPRVMTVKKWTGRWRSSGERLQSIESDLRTTRHFVIIGGESDPWDLEVRGGFLGAARLLGAIEEHGGGYQTVRFRLWPRFSTSGLCIVALLGALAGGAGYDQEWIVSLVLGLAAGALAYRMFAEAGFAMSALFRSIQSRLDADET